MFPSAPSISPSRAARPGGFTLVELLCVVAIISVLGSLVTFSILGIKGSRDLANGAYTLQGMLEQARTFAMAENTYTWVGLFEENPTAPGTAGTGQLVISVVASANGMNVASTSTLTLIPSASLTQVSKLTKIVNVHLDPTIPAASVTRPTVATGTATGTYEVGSSAFPSSTLPNSFVFPLGSSSPQYTFTQIIQFNPQGDATRLNDNPATVMEIGLQPTHGGSITPNETNFAVLQIAGIGGQVITYRP
jgi:prepilin-type N-terminal cleavage/methylation domain-containing protein